MKKLIESKLFIAVFLLTYFSFFAVTVLVLDIKRAGLGAGNLAYGFPFAYYYSNCYGGAYWWPGLLGNVLFAGLLGAASGLLIMHWQKNRLEPWRQKISSPEFRRKWHL